jgi:catechol 2,3-dioxygenase-like lactoylglutathione lyase family enzyme
VTLEAIDHVDLVISSLERSVPFYEGLLRPLGYVQVGEIEGEEGERVVYLSRHQTDGSIGLRERQSGLDTADRYAIGLHHLAFSASSRQVVEEVADRARAAGAEIESEPRGYDYTPGYYAVFLHDPDRIKLEIVHRPEEGDLVARVAELEARLAELEKPSV